jgi:uncharacterized coiled-coil DUF342 family protein
MKNLYSKLTVFFVFCTVVALLMFVSEQKQSRELASQLNQVESQLEEVEARRSGLEQANEELRKKMEQTNNAPPLFTLGNDEEEVESDTVVETLVGRDRSDMRITRVDEPADEDVEGEKPELTPEQIAAREEREQRMQAWREEREKRREEFRDRVSSEVQERKNFFRQISTEGLAPEYKEAHARLLTAMDEVDAGMQQLANSELTRDERRTVMRELYQKSREISGLMDMQRDVLLNDYAQQALGMDGKQTQEFIDYMQTVNEMTSSSMMRGGRDGR